MRHALILGTFTLPYAMASFANRMITFSKMDSSSEQTNYVPQTSVQDFIVWEVHAGGLASHFEKNKTIAQVEEQFYLPSLKRDVANIVSQCCTCQMAKQ